MNQATAPTAMTATATKTAMAATCDFFSGGGGTAGSGATGGGIDALCAAPAVVLIAAARAGATSVGSGIDSIVASAEVGSEMGIDPVDSAAAAWIAAANSFAVWNRSLARFASALRITASIAGSTCTLSDDGGNGSSLSTFCIVVVADPADQLLREGDQVVLIHRPPTPRI